MLFKLLYGLIILFLKEIPVGPQLQSTQITRPNYICKTIHLETNNAKHHDIYYYIHYPYCKIITASFEIPYQTMQVLHTLVIQLGNSMDHSSSTTEQLIMQIYTQIPRVKFGYLMQHLTVITALGNPRV